MPVENYALADWAIDGLHLDERRDVRWRTEVVPCFVFFWPIQTR
jgi:hypothetical protein